MAYGYGTPPSLVRVGRGRGPQALGVAVGLAGHAPRTWSVLPELGLALAFSFGLLS